MDFWAAQKRARKQTTVYLILFLVITVGISVAAELAFQAYQGRQFPFVGPLFLLVTLCVAGINYAMFKAGGGARVAESMDGQLVTADSNDPLERQFYNIVEEIAIASSMQMPAVYVLPANQINAFAAGTKPENAALAVTRGALEQLSRDELQGVVAHEFGHIHNADMLIGMRLAAMVMGFFFILYIALRVLQFAGMGSGGRSRGDKKGGNPVAIIALILLAAGALAWLFGSILKAAVSRQREYLADASSVQFTRNPSGIAGALRKIGQEEVKDMPKSGMAFSHLYLDSHSSLDSIFATHPPLKKRIEAIEGETRGAP